MYICIYLTVYIIHNHTHHCTTINTVLGLKLMYECLTCLYEMFDIQLLYPIYFCQHLVNLFANFQLFTVLLQLFVIIGFEKACYVQLYFY